MSGLVAHLDDTILVERHLFGLMDVDVDSCPRPWPQGPVPLDEDVWAQPNRVDLRSAGEDHEVAVRLEAWRTAPEPPAGDWAGGDEVRATFSSAEVQLWTLTMGPSPATFRIGPPGREYALRVWCRGHDRVLELEHEGLPIPDGTERYVLQFQPL